MAWVGWIKPRGFIQPTAGPSVSLGPGLRSAWAVACETDPTTPRDAAWLVSGQTPLFGSHRPLPHSLGTPAHLPHSHHQEHWMEQVGRVSAR